uniref:histidine--tRNA ligase n=1 Tax=Gelidium vagum TaxID=35171 RepID=A0A141SE91_GELVA|nr:histidine-tRNA synthetase [Gelidium vagum]AMK96609.1 histidine-tRNA synthetase [Gelidium vagum]
MQILRGTKDILNDEIIFWRHIYDTALKVCSLYNYHEIQTPILELTSLFTRSIGNDTDIVNKEMYSFTDQGQRNITLRPEGTASIARSFITNKLYINNSSNKFWYLGPMFRYERPQSGRQRQFHQLGVECLGSAEPIADAEVIRIATKILHQLKLTNYKLEINSIGNLEERQQYQLELLMYLEKYKNDLDQDSQKRLENNPLRILDSKYAKTQEILQQAPILRMYLGKESKHHFDTLCDYLNSMNIKYNINEKLVRGLDYYNYTAFEIKCNELGSQDTVCGGGRYDYLIKSLGGPDTASVGWAMGIERLLLIINNRFQPIQIKPDIYIATKGMEAKLNIWPTLNLLEENNIPFELDLQNNSFQKQLKRANKLGLSICLLIGEDEIRNNNITIKYLKERKQKIISLNELIQEIQKYSKTYQQTLTIHR